MKEKVLFIAPSQFSIGELHNAIYLSRQLESNGRTCHFLTSQNHLDYALNSGVKATPLRKKTMQTVAVKEVVQSFDPDAIIIADYHNLDLESPLIDLDFVLSLGLPTATIDSLCFGTESKVLKNRLFEENLLKRTRSTSKAEAFLRKIPETMKVIRTCPINDPSVKNERIQPVTLYKRPFNMELIKKEEVRQRFGCHSKTDKLIMVSKAAWANLFVKMRLMETKLYMDRKYSYEHFIQQLIECYLGVREVPSKVVIVGIAPENSLIQHASESKIKFVGMSFLNIKEYEDLLFSCDLFITDNVTSCSMAKALFGYVPVLSLVNTKVNTGDGGNLLFPEIWESQEGRDAILQKWTKVLPKGIYPFLTFPNGWVDELQPLLANNPFMEAIEISEIFNIRETGEKIYNLLYCEKTKKIVNEKQEKYINLIINTPDANDMMEFILDKKMKERLSK
ncbi:glycosyltransferase [Bacillus sp. CH30_1T]|uniref:DUF6365 family protein n=1 Tax=Bacillus sp. CH30_1T TaxID=2604836 RepID=UPI0011EF806C|nr:DUF6365 family protein [Bacillus sp. CH30_1T]KAA0560848.1 glycosyltransferase [Bacillus sp. CH30_1T]